MNLSELDQTAILDMYSYTDKSVSEALIFESVNP